MMVSRGASWLLLGSCITLAASMSHLGAFDDSIQYDIRFAGFGEEPRSLLYDRSSPMPVTTAQQEQYSCYFPLDEDDAAEHTKHQSAGDTPAVAPGEWLHQRFGSQCLLRLEGYWSYEYCHENYLRQFHDVKRKKGEKLSPENEYFLGYHPAVGQKKEPVMEEANVAEPPEMIIDGESVPYYSIIYKDGTPCDLTKQKRSTEVRFICIPGSQNMIFQVSEVSTCTYMVIIQTHLLCDLPQYKAKTIQSREIVCVGATPSTPSHPTSMPINVFSWLGRHYAHRQSLQENAERQAALAQQTDTAHAAQHQHQQVQVPPQTSPNPDFVPNPNHIQTAPGAVPNQSKQQQHQQQQPHQSTNALTGAQQRAAAAAAAAAAEEARKAAQPVAPISHHEAWQHVIESCIQGGGNSWWVYEVCIGRHVKQIHNPRPGVNEDGTVDKRVEVLLGKWDYNEHYAWWYGLTAKQQESYTELRTRKVNAQTSIHFTHGDVCDITKKPRVVDVVLICDPSLKGAALALRMEEARVCEYLIIISSNMICSVLRHTDNLGIPVKH